MHPSLSRALIACVLLAGCTPEPPDKERPPEPKAAQASVEASKKPDPTSNDPIERARSVQDTLDQADQNERDAIKDAGG